MNMDPRHLEAMLHGEHHVKKNDSKKPASAIDLELESEIDNYVDGLVFEDDKNHRSLESPKAKKDKMKLELKKTVKLPDLSKSLDSAMNILLSEGSTLLSSQAYEKLISDFANGAKLVSNMKLSETADTSIHQLAKFSEETMSSIAAIAISKYNEEKFEDCISLFSLLTIFNPAYSEYWLRLGMAAQKSSHFELAARAYASALELDPDLIEGRLFSAECYAALKDFDRAKNEIAEAKKITERIKVDKKLIDLIPVIENSIKKA